ncbi:MULTISPECIES: monovalent cation/H+ antiporter complex subunit F [Halolamina]|uniref:Multicomponent Na+:H+ antiporter subunit F n=1 Tax=Halolamina pelagica TaxID=699431 RepID=A0A1I5SYB1_9EURY|nr:MULTISPECIES: monovalent cation/H+ antiporter complex subunit F [Halolamina]NHX36917.1 cation:proton antiporter [Halolamina sp. R1-12]SFP75749.1 multicomponent Na+:H+ antiporter subunit F [Halolamina pelagica]
MIERVLLGAATVFILVSLVGVYRTIVGPTTPDRVIAINFVGSNVVIVIALIAAAIGEPGALDIALVYALLNFLLSISISKFQVERGGVL